MRAYEDGQVGVPGSKYFQSPLLNSLTCAVLLKGLFPLRRLCVLLHGVAWW